MFQSIRAREEFLLYINIYLKNRSGFSKRTNRFWEGKFSPSEAERGETKNECFRCICPKKMFPMVSMGLFLCC